MFLKADIGIATALGPLDTVVIEPSTSAIRSKRFTNRANWPAKNFALLFPYEGNESRTSGTLPTAWFKHARDSRQTQAATGEPHCVVLAPLKLTPSLCCDGRCTSGGTYVALIARGMDSIAMTRGPLGAVVIEPPASAIQSRRSTNRANRPALKISHFYSLVRGMKAVHPGTLPTAWF